MESSVEGFGFLPQQGLGGNNEEKSDLPFICWKPKSQTKAVQWLAICVMFLLYLTTLHRPFDNIMKLSGQLSWNFYSLPADETEFKIMKNLNSDINQEHRIIDS